MTPLIGQTWGPHKLCLSVPAVRVRLDGLSAAQVASLEDDYRQFAERAPGGNDDYIACRACRLDGAPSLSTAELTRGGLYAPRQVRSVEGMALTGTNFEARVWNRPSPTPAELGVAQEHELAQANVIDNFLRVLAAQRALGLGGVVLHSGGFAIEGAAYLFSARSGTGKTTLTRKALHSGARVLSDDINLLSPVGGGYRAHAVPFTGELGRTLRSDEPAGSYPLKCLVLLERGERLETEKVKAADAVARLLVNCPFVNDDPEASPALFDVLTDLVTKVPVLRLRCGRDDDIDNILTAVHQRLEHARTQ